MGVHSGLVVVGGLGQDPQPHATAIGAPVALALRLQQRAAPGTILLSAATYHLVHAEVRAAPCGTLDMDGGSTPVPVYTVQGLLRRHAGVAGRGPRAESPLWGGSWSWHCCTTAWPQCARGRVRWLVWSASPA
jgi:class 3 adenylate cyclase